jgi:hypothetical protein
MTKNDHKTEIYTKCKTRGKMWSVLEEISVRQVTKRHKIIYVYLDIY